MGGQAVIEDCDAARGTGMGPPAKNGTIRIKAAVTRKATKQEEATTTTRKEEILPW